MVYKRGSAWDYHSVASSIEIVYENPLCRVTLIWVKPKFMFNSNWGHLAQGVAEIAIFFYCCFSFIRVQTGLQDSSVTRLLSLFQLKTFFASNWMHFVYKLDHLFQSTRVSDENSSVKKTFHFSKLVSTQDFFCIQNMQHSKPHTEISALSDFI